jgi:pimeloyl-ACP methyl ester carboxylesterase
MLTMSAAKVFWIAAIAFAAGIAVASLLALRDARQRIESLENERHLAATRHGQIEYIAWGDGPPVVAIHGAGGGFDQGRLLARSLGGDGFRWLAVSRFGYLGSGLPENPSTAAQAEAIADLLDALGIERANLLAMSGGVPPALKFAEMFPGKAGRMVLLSSAPFTPFGPDVEDRPVPTWVYSTLLGNDVIYWLLMRFAREKLVEAFDARADLRPDLSQAERDFVDGLIDTFVPASRRVQGLGTEAAAVDADATYGLESIVSPVLVVHAKDDRINPFEIGAAIARRIGQAEFVPLETGGHLLLGHHAELRTRIRAFLAAAADD